MTDEQEWAGDVALTTALSDEEVEALGALEATIAAGLQTFFEVGGALLEIREQRLYRADFETFDAYCDARWGFTRQRASQLIQSARTVGALTAGAATSLPANEAQARPLSALAPEKRADAWAVAVERAGGQPTAGQVREVVDEMLGKAGRFRNNDWYVVNEAEKLVYSRTFKGGWPGDDELGVLYGGHMVKGEELNSRGEYNAYTLVEVPDWQPRPIQDVLPGFNHDWTLPVDEKAGVIYTDNPSWQDFDAVYRPLRCTRTWGTTFELNWYSVIRRWGDFQVLPAIERPAPPAQPETPPQPSDWQTANAATGRLLQAPAAPETTPPPKPSQEKQDALDVLDNAGDFLKFLIERPDDLKAALEDGDAITWWRDRWAFGPDGETLPDWLVRAGRWLLAMSDGLSRAAMIDDDVPADEEPDAEYVDPHDDFPDLAGQEREDFERYVGDGPEGDIEDADSDGNDDD